MGNKQTLPISYPEPVKVKYQEYPDKKKCSFGVSNFDDSFILDIITIDPEQCAKFEKFYRAHMIKYHNI